MKKPAVHIVKGPDRPLETILSTWFNSRDEGPVWTVENFWTRLLPEKAEYLRPGEGRPEDYTIFQRLMKEKATGVPANDAVELFYQIMAMDIPVTEFIVFNICFDNVPRTFVDQLDRTRHAAFWERSLRVMDLSNFADREEFFVPENLQGPAMEKYYEGMYASQYYYRENIRNGVSPELARGVAPLHVNTRADMSVSFRTLVQIVRKRDCFFAQGTYWEPVINQLLPQVCGFFPLPQRAVALFNTLPCDLEKNECKCPYKRDIMDRLVDRSNPICPILYLNELGDEERDRTVKGMTAMYGKDKYIQIGTRYLEAVRPGQMGAEFVQDVIFRSQRDVT
jgi:hypothetical protein